MSAESDVEMSDDRSSKRAKTSHGTVVNDELPQGPQPPSISTPSSLPSPTNKADPSSLQSGSSSDSPSCRKKQPLSCGECRRLKLKCDRVFPCKACVKRGCEGICPEGSLVSGRGSRYILANTERLHEKIIQMSDRIRDLENALCTLHTEHCLCSGNPVGSHPLLQGPQLLVKAHLELYGLETGRSGPESPVSSGSSDRTGDSITSNATVFNELPDVQSQKSNAKPSTLPADWLDSMSFSGSDDEHLQFTASVETNISTPSMPESSIIFTSPSTVNPLQHSMDLSMTSFHGVTEMLDPLLFGQWTGQVDSPLTAAGGTAQVHPDTVSRIHTDSAPKSPDTSTPSTPAISLDRYFITWLTQLWLSHMTNPNLPGTAHVSMNDPWGLPKPLDPSLFSSPSSSGSSTTEDASAWMRLLSQGFGNINYQPFA
ncbi:hypothetical protein SCHPADRAFT_994453 [Schizopora paradoxa]|uniref:Zn(2)-C6 fungal-type domain-containing protein n=1 Tax=Schizopora paradoxa TaxID=27342 RepID=A0A0H2RYU9_9AGAM|nr:hypothetical protein SCHPADRAFT_994453 [Schizopora paradoxa]